MPSSKPPVMVTFPRVRKAQIRNFIVKETHQTNKIRLSERPSGDDHGGSEPVAHQPSRKRDRARCGSLRMPSSKKLRF